MDAIDLLEKDHREVESMFAQFEAATDETQQAMLAEKICKALTVHTTIEEELFYPAAKECLDVEDENLIVDALQEHAEAKEMIAKIKTMNTGEELNQCMKELKAAIEHHVSDEEDDMFPELEEKGMETTQLGVQMESRKQQLMSTVK